MVNIHLNREVRLVKDNKLVYIYLGNPIVSNITNIDNSLEATANSGTLLFSSFPEEGLDIYNRDWGAIVEYDTNTSGYIIKNQIDFETNLRRSGIAISGSKFIGRT